MPTRRARLRRKIYRKLPRWLKNYDFEVFASSLGVLGGLPLMFGQVKPSSVDALLPHTVVQVWGAVLTFGCLAVFLGIYHSSRKHYPDKIFWMRVEAVGLTALAYFCYLYVLCLLLVAFQSAWVGIMIILAFGATCHVREATINIELEQYRLSLGLEERA